MILRWCISERTSGRPEPHARDVDAVATAGDQLDLVAAGAQELVRDADQADRVDAARCRPVEVAQLVLHHMAVDRDVGRRAQSREVQRLRMRLDRAEIGRHPVAHLLRRLGDVAEAMQVGQRRARHAAVRQRALGGAELDRRRVRAAGIDERREDRGEQRHQRDRRSGQQASPEARAWWRPAMSRPMSVCNRSRRTGSHRSCSTR